MRFAGPALEPVLLDLEKSLNSVLSFSFFITRRHEDRPASARDLKRHPSQFSTSSSPAAGNHHRYHILVALDKSGKPHSAAPNEQVKDLHSRGAITFTGGPDASPQTLYYFTTDLSNEGIRQQPGFLQKSQRPGVGRSLPEVLLISDV